MPPAAALDLEPIYGAALAELGLRLIDRGGLIDRSGGGYEPSPTGTHLALYVEPIGDERSVDEYLDGIRNVGVVFSDLFERWPGLVSYDVCQEPIEDDGDPATEPLPVTQIELTKEESAAIDWDTVDGGRPRPSRHRRAARDGPAGEQQHGHRARLQGHRSRGQRLARSATSA